MFSHIKIIKPLRPFDCAEYGSYLTSEDFEAAFSETQPIEGYEAPEKYPHCCGFHKNLEKDAQSFFEKFPLCCEWHAKLINQPWFNKNDYSQLPKKIVNTFSHTEYHIVQMADHENWYQEITDYLEYAIRSFGQLPDGFGVAVGLNIFIGHLEYRLEHWEALPKKVSQQLLQFLRLRMDQSQQQRTTDLNLLLTTYNKWLKTFPFELSFFTHLKERFQKKVPLIKGDIHFNKYLNAHYAKILTKEELVNYLINLTKQILTALNSATLFEQGRLTDVNKVQLELLVKERKGELELLGNLPIDERKQYIRLIKNWNKGEQQFLKKLKPLFQAPAMDTNNSSSHTFNIYGSSDVNINIGNDNIIHTLSSIVPGDIARLAKALDALQVPRSDADEIIQIIQQEPAHHKSVFGTRTSEWINKMLQKAQTGVWQIAAGGAGGVLTEIINKFFGL